MVSTAVRTSRALAVSSWWSVPRCVATLRAASASDTERSSKPSVKVLIAPAKHAIVAESMPPERNRPIGTSETSCDGTISSSSASVRATASVMSVTRVSGEGAQ